ncbi:MAG: vitamin K epoxide reductase family protein [Pseudomonadota bacterium]|nr:vitamin K epoxide reductase family protein [Pseudomonadota bacterium]
MIPTRDSSAQSPKLIWLALFSTLASVLVHIYLYTVHLKTQIGVGEDSICDLSKKFNCSAVVSSTYSEIFGTPVAMFGAVSNLILLLMLVNYKLFSTNHRQAQISFWFSTPILFASFIMGAISLSLMHVYCPFCILLYGFSLVSFLSLWNLSGTKMYRDFFPFVGSLNKSKTLAVYLTILALSWLVNAIVWQNTGLADLEKMESTAIQEWQSNTQYDFSALQGIEFGSHETASPFFIVEFADFLCSHCQTAAQILHEFVDSHPTARLLYFTFPLDGCEAGPKGEVGPNCRISKNAFCANQLGKGPESHSWFFKNLVGVSGFTEVDQKIEQSLTELKLNKDDLQKCMKSPDTELAIKKLINAGKQAGVKGTPSIYVNGRQLPYAHRKTVLQKAYNSLGLN